MFKTFHFAKIREIRVKSLCSAPLRLGVEFGFRISQAPVDGLARIVKPESRFRHEH
jgi:hypothetical protein